MTLFYPDFRFGRIDQIPVSWLVKKKITVLLLDVDNTLTTHNNPDILPEIQNWLDEVKSAGIRLLIISNNNRKRVEPFAGKLGIGCIASAKKPLTIGVARAKKRLNVQGQHIALVGDQVFTDILCARFAGVVSILVEPMELETFAFFRLKRRFEKRILRNYRQKENL